MFIVIVILAIILYANVSARTVAPSRTKIIVFNNMTVLTSLKNDLFRDYDKNLPPMLHNGQLNEYFKENFAMTITYAKLTSVNERSMEYSIILEMSVSIFSFIFYVLLLSTWTDPRLVWNPDQYHNMSHLYTTLEEVWFPNFHPCDSSSIAYLAQENNQVAKIFSNGKVRTILQAEITYSCAFNTERFPFDVQACKFCFAITGYDAGDIAFNATIDSSAQNAFATDTSEWRVNIDNSTNSFDFCENDICMTILRYSVTLSRNPQFWIGLVIIPIFMLGFLILIGLFFSGKENLVNNAIGFGLTTMMSMMVVVAILNDSLSKIKSIPCMGLFVFIQIAVTSVAVIAVLLTDKLKSALWRVSRRQSRDTSCFWRFVRAITRDEYVLRLILFVAFSILHVANFVWLMSNQFQSFPAGSKSPNQSENFTSAFSTEMNFPQHQPRYP